MLSQFEIHILKLMLAEERDVYRSDVLRKVLDIAEGNGWQTDKPEEPGDYYITWTGELGDKVFGPFIEITEYCDDGTWDTDLISERGYKNVTVKAWMPLPKVYAA